MTSKKVRREMGKRQSSFDKGGIEDLAKNKPVVYQLQNAKGENVYTGVAKRGRVEERLKEHLPGGKDAIPGAKRVKLTQHDSIAAAERSEARIIKQAKPRYNKKGK